MKLPRRDDLLITALVVIALLFLKKSTVFET